MVWNRQHGPGTDFILIINTSTESRDKCATANPKRPSLRLQVRRTFLASRSNLSFTLCTISTSLSIFLEGDSFAGQVRHNWTARVHHRGRPTWLKGEQSVVRQSRKENRGWHSNFIIKWKNCAHDGTIASLSTLLTMTLRKEFRFLNKLDVEFQFEDFERKKDRNTEKILFPSCWRNSSEFHLEKQLVKHQESGKRAMECSPRHRAKLPRVHLEKKEKKEESNPGSWRCECISRDSARHFPWNGRKLLRGGSVPVRTCPWG